MQRERLGGKLRGGRWVVTGPRAERDLAGLLAREGAQRDDQPDARTP